MLMKKRKRFLPNDDTPFHFFPRVTTTDTSVGAGNEIRPTNMVSGVLTADVFNLVKR